MAMLYSLGVRNFGLSFDDLGNVGQDVLFGEDKAFFDGSIGKAQAYFVHQVYQRLREKHADIGFMFVPIKYNNLTARGDVDTAYLEALARLPEEIEIYSSVERAAGAQIAIDITERPHMVWDNFWASFYQGVSAPR